MVSGSIHIWLRKVPHYYFMELLDTLYERERERESDSLPKVTNASPPAFMAGCSREDLIS